jgi:hypothetical protein
MQFHRTKPGKSATIASIMGRRHEEGATAVGRKTRSTNRAGLQQDISVLNPWVPSPAESLPPNEEISEISTRVCSPLFPACCYRAVGWCCGVKTMLVLVRPAVPQAGTTLSSPSVCPAHHACRFSGSVGENLVSSQHGTFGWQESHITASRSRRGETSSRVLFSSVCSAPVRQRDDRDDRTPAVAAW